jgi:hypothetical protein
MFHRNVGDLVQGYTASHPRNACPLDSLERWELQSEHVLLIVRGSGSISVSL